MSFPYGDSSVATNHCYRYEYLVSDNYGLQGTITSASIVKVDTTRPSGGSVSVPTYSKRPRSRSLRRAAPNAGNAKASRRRVVRHRAGSAIDGEE